jgi:hypothetical protein
MQRMEVSCAVRHIYIYIYIYICVCVCVISRLRVKGFLRIRNIFVVAPEKVWDTLV